MGDGRLLSKGTAVQNELGKALGTSSGWAWRLYVFRLSSKCDWKLFERLGAKDCSD